MSDNEWTRTHAKSLTLKKKLKPIPNEYPNSSDKSLRQLGKTKPKSPTDAALNFQTKIPVAQQGTGPFGNEWNPSPTFNSLAIHEDQNGRLCLLVSAVSLLFLGVGCIVACFTGASILDSALASSCSKFGTYWKYRCIPVDDSQLNSFTACTSANAKCCMGNCVGSVGNDYKQCAKRCTEKYPNFENDLSLAAFQRTDVVTTKSWGQKDPVAVCQDSALSQTVYGPATWSSVAPKSRKASDWHWAVSRGCWSAGVLAFIVCTLGAGLFGVLAAVYTNFGLGVVIFQGLSLVFCWFFFVVGALSFALASYWQDFWFNRYRPTCHDVHDKSPLLWLTDCLTAVPLCRMWEENYQMIFAIFIAIGIMFLLAGLVMLFGGIYIIYYPVFRFNAEEEPWTAASFSPMVGGRQTVAESLSLAEQAHRLHTNLTGRPGHLPLTYTIQLPHKNIEELYDTTRRP